MRPLVHASTLRRRATTVALALVSIPGAAAAQEATLAGPASASAGSEFTVAWSGAADPRDFITIVPVDTPEGRYEAYAYARDNPVTLAAPQQPGRYELRYLAAASPYPTRARAPIEILDVEASLAAPAEVAAGDEFAVEWAGPDNARDFIGLVQAGAAEGTYNGPYKYTREGSPLRLRAPDTAGQYELRYMLGASPYRTIGRAPVRVTGVAATLTAPPSIAAGATFAISWEGPNNAQDFITIVPAGAAERTYEAYVYTAHGNPAELAAPEIAGDYELRYLTGQVYATLAAIPITVTPVSASLEAPSSAPARDAVAVTWQGPGNPTDYVILLPAGSDNAASGNYAYVTRGPVLRIATPAEPGDYELRYLTGNRRLTLASRPITIATRPAPGTLRVVDESSASPTLAGAAVAVVLDASGSMLQRIDGERRIDIAKRAVGELVGQTLPESVAFALRVFGHREADSCRTDLEVPVGALDRSTAAAKVAAIEAMNLARTPIAESLRLAAADIASHPPPHLIVLVTDGEETCGGDPAAVIEALAAGGADVRVNIVGLAIDELMLQETFADWARLGNGKYFNARDGAELAASLRESLEVPFSVLDAQGARVATGTINGPPVAVDAGTYRIVAHGNPPRSIDAVVVQAEAEARVALPAP
jgi:hypothetical protein